MPLCLESCELACGLNENLDPLNLTVHSSIERIRCRRLQENGDEPCRRSELVSFGESTPARVVGLLLANVSGRRYFRRIPFATVQMAGTFSFVVGREFRRRHRRRYAPPADLDQVERRVKKPFCVSGWPMLTIAASANSWQKHQGSSTRIVVKESRASSSKIQRGRCSKSRAKASLCWSSRVNSRSQPATRSSSGDRWAELHPLQRGDVPHPESGWLARIGKRAAQRIRRQ